MSRTLRPYQSEAITQILAKWLRLKRIIYVLATGGGKSFTMFSLIQYLVDIEDAYIVMAVKKRNLVFQLEEDAKDFGLDYGVFMAGEIKNDSPIQICSIDTLRSRADYPHRDKDNVYLFIDEADESNNDSYHGFRDAYPQAKELGVTATPFNGLYFYDDYVETITANELIKLGVLTPVRYIVPKKKLETSDIKIKKGDFDSSELDAATIVGDVVENWFLFSERRQTIAFCNSVKKSKELVAKFQAAGVTAVHIDADTPEENRRAAVAMFKYGEVTILSNVKLLIRGSNILEIGCMLDVGATTSLNLYRQKIGRGVRANKFYKDLIYIDHTGNCLAHGEFTDEIEIDLKEKVKFTRAEVSEKMIVCSNCFRAFTPAIECPYCKTKVPKKERKSKKEEAGEMTEIDSEEFARQKIVKDYKKAMFIFMKYNHGDDPAKRGRVHVDLIEKHGLKKILEVKKEIKLKRWHIIKYAKKVGRFISTEGMGLE